MQNRCEICKLGITEVIIELEAIPPLNNIITNSLETLPVVISCCNYCSIVQTTKRFEKNVIFPEDYPFRTSNTKTMRSNLDNLAEIVSSFLHGNSNILEVGCNDGYLLSKLATLNKHYNLTGVEPTAAVHAIDKESIKVIKNFYEDCTFKQEEFDCIILTNTYCHVNDLNKVSKMIWQNLKSEGILVIEMLDLDSMISNIEFDKFTHEQGYYFTDQTISDYLNAMGFLVESIQKLETHGGSLRLIARKSLQKNIQKSNSNTEISTRLKQLFKQIPVWKKELSETATRLASQGFNIEKSVWVGSTNRGLMLYNIGLRDSAIKFEVAIDHEKSQRINSELPILGIKVISDREFFNTLTNVYFISPWHIADEIISNLREIGFKGVALKPLPNIEVISL